MAYNPRHTANLHGEVMAEAREMAAHRQLEEIHGYEEAFPRRQGRPGFKNFLGTALLLEAHPENISIVKNYWKEEDQRPALIGRLIQPWWLDRLAPEALIFPPASAAARAP